MEELNVTNNYESFSVADERTILDSLLMKIKNPLTEAELMELEATNNEPSFNFVLSEEQGSGSVISASLGRALEEDLRFRLPDLPRETQLNLQDMFSESIWNSLAMEQQVKLAENILFMVMDVVYIMPLEIGDETKFSIHDHSSPTADIAYKAVRTWLRDDERHKGFRKQFMEEYLKARCEGVCSPELDLLFKVIKFCDE